MRSLLLLAAGFAACTLRGDGERVEQTRELPPFTAVEVFNNFAVTLTIDRFVPDDEPIDVTVSGDGNALARLFTLVHGEGALSVGVDPNTLTELTMTPELVASVPALRSAYAADAATLEIVEPEGELTLTALEHAAVTLSDGEDLSLTATVQGAAELVIDGAGPLLELVVEDDATVDARWFLADKVVVRARGAGKIRVCATTEITILGPGAPQVALGCG